MRLSLPTLAVVLVCAACPLPAAAADKAETAPGPETADSLYNQGNDAYDRGDLSLAFELYTGAFKLRKSYDVARNLGLVELKLGRIKDAIGHLQYSLSLYPSNRADTKKQVIEWLEQATTQVGKLRLHVSPESADCRLNGAPVTREEREEDMLADPGEVKIECRAPGRRTEKRTVTVQKGARAEVTIQLAPDASGPGGGPGPEAPAGSRTVLLWSGSAAAVTGLGVGAAMGVVSLVKAAEADGMLAKLKSDTGRASPCLAPKADACDELYALRREQDAFGNAAFWMLVVGGVAGAGTFAYGFVTAPKNGAPPAPKVAFTPVVAPGVTGVVLLGSF